MPVSSIEVVDKPRPLPLSPSRVADFKACPQLFKFRVLDRLPEPVDPATARGSLLHVVLERLFLVSKDERTFERALDILGEALETIRAEQEIPFVDDPELERAWVSEAKVLLGNYFRIEDPRHLEADQLEYRVEYEAERVFLRGIIDRVDVLPDGEWILTDYKTGPSPPNWRSLGSFFGLRFYALVCWRSFGKIPKELRLVHLREPEVLTLVPTPQMLEGLERQLEAVGSAIRRAWSLNDWRPRRGRLCNWCPHKPVCPAWRKERDAAELVGAQQAAAGGWRPAHSKMPPPG